MRPDRDAPAGARRTGGYPDAHTTAVQWVPRRTSKRHACAKLLARTAATCTTWCAGIGGAACGAVRRRACAGQSLPHFRQGSTRRCSGCREDEAAAMQMARFLLNHGADASARNLEGRTAGEQRTAAWTGRAGANAGTLRVRAAPEPASRSVTVGRTSRPADPPARRCRTTRQGRSASTTPRKRPPPSGSPGRG